MLIARTRHSRRPSVTSTRSRTSTSAGSLPFKCVVVCLFTCLLFCWFASLTGWLVVGICACPRTHMCGGSVCAPDRLTAYALQARSASVPRHPSEGPSRALLLSYSITHSTPLTPRPPPHPTPPPTPTKIHPLDPLYTHINPPPNLFPNAVAH